MKILYFQSALIHKIAGMFQTKQEKHACLNYFFTQKIFLLDVSNKRTFLGISSEKKTDVRLGAASVGVVGFRV